MKNYAGHRLSPWLGHLMISRQETARPLLTAGEVMQLPPNDELVLMSGCPPIRAKKARYFEDRRFAERILPPAKLDRMSEPPAPDEWSSLPPRRPSATLLAEIDKGEDTANSGLRREPELPDHLAMRETRNSLSPMTPTTAPCRRACSASNCAVSLGRPRSIPATASGFEGTPDASPDECLLPA